MKDPWFYQFEKFADGVVENAFKVSVSAAAFVGSMYNPSIGPSAYVSVWGPATAVYKEMHPTREARRNEAVRVGRVTGSNPNPNPKPKRKHNPDPNHNPKRTKVATHWSDIFTK